MADNLSRDEDRETHSAVLGELIGSDIDYLDGWRQRWPDSRIYTLGKTTLLVFISVMRLSQWHK